MLRKLSYGLGATILFLALILGGWVLYLHQKWSPTLDQVIKKQRQQGGLSVFVEEDNQKKWIASFHNGKLEERSFLKLPEVPPLLIQSIVSVEDPQFLEHSGFDPSAILRAAVRNIFKGRFAQGGSTITQQLVKNLYLNHQKTLRRKITELFLAIFLEQKYSKDQILESYLNEIYLGQAGPVAIHGVHRAADYYFAKELKNLELHEMALITALIASPGSYNPWRNPEKSLARRNWVLKILHSRHIIEKKELQIAQEKKLPKQSQFKIKNGSAYLLSTLQKRLVDKLGYDNFVNSRFNLTLTLDPKLQRGIEKAASNFGEKHQELQYSVVAADPNTCQIKAYLGGSQYRLSQFDRIWQSKRSTGSLIKPLLLAKALEETPQLQLYNTIEDQKFTWEYDRQSWSPKNYDKKFRGPVSVRSILEESLNVPFVKIFYQSKWKNDLMRLFLPLTWLGLDFPQRRLTPSALLGAVEQRPWDLLRSFVALARNGLDMSNQEGCALSISKTKILLNEKASDKIFTFPTGSKLVLSALKGSLRSGTARRMKGHIDLNESWAAKTGTSSNNKDSWAVLINPSLVLLAWVGHDKAIPTKLTGSSGALEILKQAAPDFKHYGQKKAWKPSQNLRFAAVDTNNQCLRSDIYPIKQNENSFDPLDPALVNRHSSKNFSIELVKAEELKLKECKRYK